MQSSSSMRALVFIAIISSTANSFAQNWSLLNTIERFNYAHVDSTIITHVIRIDSLTIEGSDSVFHLNRILKYCSFCVPYSNNYYPHIFNQPQFLGLSISKNNLGEIIIADTVDCMIKPLAAAGASWSYNGISGSVSDATTEEIFASIDSVKTIAMSDGRIWKLSKNHGVIFCRDLYGVEYNLVGIEGRNVGEKFPVFEDVFNFQVGDVFEHRISGSDFGTSGQDYSHSSSYFQRAEIISKDTSESGFNYKVRIWVSKNFAQIPMYTTWQFNRTNSLTGFNFVSSGYEALLPYQYAGHYHPFSTIMVYDMSGFLCKSSCTVAVNTDSAINIYIPYNATVYETFVVGNELGIVEQRLSSPNGNGGLRARHINLLGTQKADGRTFGQLHDLSFFLPAINTPLLAYPNPATDDVRISIVNAHLTNFDYKCFDTTGRTVPLPLIEASDYAFAFDCSKLEPGQYFIQLTSDGIFSSVPFNVVND